MLVNTKVLVLVLKNMENMKRTVLYVFLIAILFACRREQEVDYPVLSVDIKNMNDPSVFDIFEKIEIIPLETTDNSLIGGEGVLFQINSELPAEL